MAWDVSAEGLSGRREGLAVLEDAERNWYHGGCTYCCAFTSRYLQLLEIVTHSNAKPLNIAVEGMLADAPPAASIQPSSEILYWQRSLS